MKDVPRPRRVGDKIFGHRQLQIENINRFHLGFSGVRIAGLNANMAFVLKGPDQEAVTGARFIKQGLRIKVLQKGNDSLMRRVVAITR